MKKITLLLSFVFLLFSTQSALAFKKETFLNLVIPVRELPISDLSVRTLDLPQAIQLDATISAMPTTWLLNYSAINSSTTSAYFQTLAQSPSQEIGALLEVDSQLLDSVNLRAPFSETKALLNSYETLDRIKLIDSYMQKFFEVFGTYPKSVASSYIDSFSLQYLQEKYSVAIAAFGVQGEGIAPQLDGVYPFFSYLPSRNNALVPAQTTKQKIPIAITQWNAIDPTIFTDHIKSVYDVPVNEFAQLTYGTDNFLPASQALPLLHTYEQIIKKYTGEWNLRPQKLSVFGTWLNQRYPMTSPAQSAKFISPESTKLYYSNPFYQLSITSSQSGNQIDSLTIFNKIEAEDYRQKPNFLPTLALSSYSLISQDAPVKIDFDIATAKMSSEKGIWSLVLNTDDKFLNLDANKLTTNSIINLPQHPSISSRISRGVQTVKFNSNWAPFYYSSLQTLFHLIKLLILLLILLSFFKFPPKKIISAFKKNPLISLTIILGSYVWMLTMLQGSKLTPFGLGIWGAHSHDAFVHLSLIEHFAKNPLSFSNPNFYGAQLQNYHFFYDYVVGLVSKFTLTPVTILYFKFFPIITSLLIGIFSALLMKRLKFTPASTVVSLLAIYLLGSLGFVVSALKGQSVFGGESLFWMTQSVTTLINPPFAFSLIILLSFLLLFDLWQKNLSIIKLLALSFLAGILIQIKAYAAVILLGSLLILVLKSFLQRKKNFKALILIFIASTLFTLAFFLPSYNPSKPVFIFSPLWFIRSIFSAQDRLDLTKVANAWQVYLLQKNYLKLVILHLLGILVFFIGNLGTRLLGIPTLISFFKSKATQQLIAWMTIVGFVLPLVVVQSGNSWNSIQFSYYSLFFLSLLTGPTIIALLLKSRTIIHLSLLIALIAIFSLPTTIGSLANYTSKTPSTYIPYPELRLLEHLKRQSEGLVLVPVFQEAKARPLYPPKPLFAFDSTSYITGFSSHPTFFADDINLEIMGYEYSNQKSENQRFFLTQDEQFVSKFLDKYPVKYIYLDAFTLPHIDLGKLNFSNTFDAGPYKLYTKN